MGQRGGGGGRRRNGAQGGGRRWLRRRRRCITAPHDRGVVGADERHVHHRAEHARVKHAGRLITRCWRRDRAAGTIEGRAVPHFEPAETRFRFGRAPVDVLVPAGEADRNPLIQIGGGCGRRRGVHRAHQLERAVGRFAIQQRRRLGGVEAARFGARPGPVGEMVGTMLSRCGRRLLKPVGGRDAHIHVLAQRPAHGHQEQIGASRIVGRRRAAHGETQVHFRIRLGVRAQEIHRIHGRRSGSVVDVAEGLSGAPNRRGPQVAAAAHDSGRRGDPHRDEPVRDTRGHRTTRQEAAHTNNTRGAPRASRRGGYIVVATAAWSMACANTVQ